MDVRCLNCDEAHIVDDDAVKRRVQEVRCGRCDSLHFVTPSGARLLERTAPPFSLRPAALARMASERASRLPRRFLPPLPVPVLRSGSGRTAPASAAPAEPAVDPAAAFPIGAPVEEDDVDSEAPTLRPPAYPSAALIEAEVETSPATATPTAPPAWVQLIGAATSSPAPPVAVTAAHDGFSVSPEQRAAARSPGASFTARATTAVLVGLSIAAAVAAGLPSRRDEHHARVDASTTTAHTARVVPAAPTPAIESAAAVATTSPALPVHEPAPSIAGVSLRPQPALVNTLPPGSGPTDAASAAATPTAGPPGELPMGAGRHFATTVGNRAAPEPDQPHGLENAMAAAGAATRGSTAGDDRERMLAALAVGASAASQCGRPDGPRGSGQVSITVAPSGRITRAMITSGPFLGTEVGACVARAYRSVGVLPFTGEPLTLVTSFRVP